MNEPDELERDFHLVQPAADAVGRWASETIARRFDDAGSEERALLAAVAAAQTTLCLVLRWLDEMAFVPDEVLPILRSDLLESVLADVA